MINLTYDDMADIMGQQVPWPTHLQDIADELQARDPGFNRERFIKRATEIWEKNYDNRHHPIEDHIPY